MPQGRTEIHFHALPGIDDGPRTMADAVELMRLAVADGTSRVVCTSHVRDLLRGGIGIVDELPARVQELREELERRGVEAELLVGGELDDLDVRALSDEELRTIAQGPPEEPWLLYEPPWSRPGSEYLDTAAEVRERGFGMVIPHPERSPLFRTPEGEVALKVLHREGALVQLTAGSLVGRHGEDARRLSERWLAEGLVDLVSSDAHDPKDKAPALTPAFEEIARLAGAETARRIVEDTPRALVPESTAVEGA